jgi:hypothetical protein
LLQSGYKLQKKVVTLKIRQLTPKKNRLQSYSDLAVRIAEPEENAERTGNRLNNSGRNVTLWAAFFFVDKFLPKPML